MSPAVLHGDCLALMQAIRGASVDAIVCDPPYALTAGKKGGTGAASVKLDSPYGRARIGTGNGSGGFMGKAWDSALPPIEMWAEALRVAKPGAHLVAFGGTRTFHRLACAIEDAGWEIRDTLSWNYGSGFPKSSRVNRDPRFCQCGESARSGECSSPELQPADHSDTEAASPDGDPRPEGVRRSTHTLSDSPVGYRPGSDSDGGRAHPATTDAQAVALLPECAPARSRSVALAGDPVGAPAYSPSPVPRTARPSNQGYSLPTECGEGALPCTPESTEASGCTPIHSGNGGPASSRSRTASLSSALPKDAPGFLLCQGCGKPVVDGLGTALKPAWEPIILARKPLIGTVAANVAAHGTGALNIDGCRVGASNGDDYGRSAANAEGVRVKGGATCYGEYRDIPAAYASPAGRWPANVVLDEEAAALLDAQSGELRTNPGTMRNESKPGWYGKGSTQKPGTVLSGGDTGGASRFFYTAKSSRAEREAGLEGMPETVNADLTGGDRNRENDRAGTNRNGPLRAANVHPTVKPLALMRWLCRLVTPPGGLILDPFAGSGSTGCAAVQEGFRFLGIEREAEYCEIARRRIAHAIQLCQADLFGGAA